MKYKHTNIGICTVPFYDKDKKMIILEPKQSIILNEKYQYNYLVIEPVGKEEEVSKEKDIEQMNKDELLDYTAKNNIEADYSMTKKELIKTIKGEK